MSTLSQIISAGGGTVDVGGATFFPTPIPTNITIAGKEYLRTGTLKTFSNTYSEFTDLNVLFSSWEVSTVNTGWKVSASGTPVNFVYANNTYFFLTYSVPNKVIRGSDVNSAPTATNDLGSNEFFNDAIAFNNLIVLVGRNTSTGNTIIRNSNGNGTYTLVHNRLVSGSSEGYTLVAANNNTIVAADWRMSTTSGKIVTSTDGTNWTLRSGPSDMNALLMASFFWSPVANAFFYITDAGRIFTSTDGFTVTERTVPTGMPTSIDNGGGQSRSTRMASSNTATVVRVGSTKLLRITGLTNYSIIDLSDFSNAGTLSADNSVVYDGARFIYGNALSSDNGATWSVKFATVTPGGASINQSFKTVVNNLYIVGATIGGEGGFYNMTGYGSANTPTLLGTSTAVNTGSSNLPIYWRIK